MTFEQLFVDKKLKDINGYIRKNYTDFDKYINIIKIYLDKNK